MRNDTIAAIATGLSDAGISIIRISGTNAFSIADCIFRSKKQGDCGRLSFFGEKKSKLFSVNILTQRVFYRIIEI